MFARWPLTDREFVTFLKGIWWFGHARTIQSYWKTVGNVMLVATRRMAEVQNVALTEVFKAAHDLRKMFPHTYHQVNAIAARHVMQGVHRAEQVRCLFPWLCIRFQYPSQFCTVVSLFLSSSSLLKVASERQSKPILLLLVIDAMPQSNLMSLPQVWAKNRVLFAASLVSHSGNHWLLARILLPIFLSISLVANGCNDLACSAAVHGQAYSLGVSGMIGF